jgi:hypothetical protein
LHTFSKHAHYTFKGDITRIILYCHFFEEMSDSLDFEK